MQNAKTTKKRNPMKQILMILLAGLLTFVVGAVKADNEITVKSMPPVVVKTFPQAGETTVDHSIKEIRVTFSKEMMTKEMWSWVIVSEASFPKITGKVRYLKDNKTCVAPVDLAPGKTYAIWFNSKKFNAFRDIDNNPAIPYLLVFQTKE
jgi:hypothetical protein